MKKIFLMAVLSFAMVSNVFAATKSKTSASKTSASLSTSATSAITKQLDSKTDSKVKALKTANTVSAKTAKYSLSNLGIKVGSGKISSFEYTDCTDESTAVDTAKSAYESCYDTQTAMSKWSTLCPDEYTAALSSGDYNALISCVFAAAETACTSYKTSYDSAVTALNTCNETYSAEVAACNEAAADVTTAQTASDDADKELATAQAAATAAAQAQADAEATAASKCE